MHAERHAAALHESDPGTLDGLAGKCNNCNIGDDALAKWGCIWNALAGRFDAVSSDTECIRHHVISRLLHTKLHEHRKTRNLICPDGDLQRSPLPLSLQDLTLQATPNQWRNLAKDLQATHLRVYFEEAQIAALTALTAVCLGSVQLASDFRQRTAPHANRAAYLCQLTVCLLSRPLTEVVTVFVDEFSLDLGECCA